MRGAFQIALAAGLLMFGTGMAPGDEGGFARGAILDGIVENAIAADQIPGAVLVVGQGGKVLYTKAYGSRSLAPKKEPMTLDTVFDAASLTKVVATTSSIMVLFEQGKIRLSDPVTRYLPQFQHGKSPITVQQLLTHFSGLRPDVDLKPEWQGYDTGIAKAMNDVPVAPPGTRYIYSDINFLLLGEIVTKVSKLPLGEFARRYVFEPLGMEQTMFQPPPSLIPRIAPTEAIGNHPPLRGEVHDPTARFMGGVAGHAGLFTTAADLTKFVEMMVGLGERDGVRIFSPLTVRKFTSPATPVDQPVLRGLGWDIDSPHSGNRGELFPIGSYGHTGFTGTSIWIDPYTKGFVILLSNSVHPKLRPAITPLRARVATAAAAALNTDLPQSMMGNRPAQLSQVSAANPAGGEVLTGLDVLANEKFAPLRGRNIGLITNQTGISREGKRNVDLMVAGGVQIKALFSPEHGIAGVEDKENVGDAKDAATGLPVFSLYSGANRRPNDRMLAGIDTLVFDIQDVGSRFYTYSCTMRNALEEAARKNLTFVVLDRPNPITGRFVEGPMLDPALKSFVGCMEVPVRHGMTMGELARMANAELSPPAKLEVIALQNWRRDFWFDETGLQWVDPSPNMRSLNAALLYPAIGMLEAAKVYSVGRGTDAPFEQIGAAWMDGSKMAGYLNQQKIPGVRVYPTRFKPSTSNFSGQTIGGVRFVITDRDRFSAARLGLEVGAAIARLFPGQMDWKVNQKLVGSTAVVTDLEAGKTADVIETAVSAALPEFLSKRQRFLLY